MTFLLLLLLLAQAEQPVTRVAFGSCAKQTEPQPIWDRIVERQPDLFLFIGDTIYADTTDMHEKRQAYARLGDHPGYRRMKETCPILAVWDDHDYGRNNAAGGYPKKEESQALFLDFFDVPADSPRRARPGIYVSHTLGPPGKRLQLLMLDTRYFKSLPVLRESSAPENVVGWFVPTDDPSTTILGEEQWSWLEAELEKPADLRLVVSSIQVLAYERQMECWGNFPHERQRLIELLEEAGNALILSGDVHFAELSSTGKLLDFTSSGMTHTSPKWAATVNSLQTGQPYAGKNFGLVEIDWEQGAVDLSVVGLDGQTHLRHRWVFRDAESALLDGHPQALPPLALP